MARAVDRIRVVSAQLEQSPGARDGITALRMKDLDSSERRALMLLNALRCFYASLGSFAVSAITSLLGATLADGGFARLSAALELVALGAGFVAVTGLVVGCVLLLRETRIGSDRQRRGRAPAEPLCGRRASIVVSGRLHSVDTERC